MNYKRVPPRPTHLGDEVVYPFNDGEIERKRREVVEAYAHLSLAEINARYGKRQEPSDPS